MKLIPHANSTLLAGFLAFPLLLIATGPRPSRADNPPPLSDDARRKAAEKVREEALIRGPVFGFDQKAERAANDRMRAEKATPQAVLARFRAYQKLVLEVERQCRAGGRSIPSDLYRVGTEIFELIPDTGTRQPASAADLIVYCRWHEGTGKLGAQRRIRAADQALENAANPREEGAAMYLRLRAVMLLDQDRPGDYEGEMNQTLDRLRRHGAGFVELRQGLEQAGNHYLRAKQYDRARSLYEEAVAQFGRRARAATLGLERLQQLGK